MLKNITHIFSRKKKTLEEEVVLKLKIDEIISKFVKEEIIKNTDLDYRLSYVFNKGVIKIETDSKLIAQEIALRARTIEEKLRNEGIKFRKVLV